MLLPNRLLDFEQYLFWDDYPEHPNTIGCRIQLSGSIDEQSLRNASAAVLTMHPLLRSLLTVTGSRLSWTEIADSPHIVRLDDAYINLPYVKKIDLDKEIGGQLHWASNGQIAALNFLMHHATADGLGGLQVVSDWMTAYSNEMKRHAKSNTSNQPLKVRRVDSGLLNSRGNHGFRTWKFFKKIPRQLIGLLGVWEFLRNRPVTLKPTSKPCTSKRSTNRAQTQSAETQNLTGLETIEVGSVDEIRELASGENATTNDVVLHNIFVGVANWRREFQYGSDNDLLRIMVPMNLRTIRDRYLPAANKASLVSLDRKQEKCVAGKELLDSIRFQMGVIQKNELGFTFLHMLRLYRWMPGGLRRIAQKDRVGSTVLVTNLGEPFKRISLPKDEQGKVIVGDLRLDGFDLIAPLRPNTHAAFAIFRYAGKLMISLTYNQRIISKDEASRLGELVKIEIRKHLSQN